MTPIDIHESNFTLQPGTEPTSGPACRPSAPNKAWTDRWFPDLDGDGGNHADPIAVDACRRCPMRAGCLMGAVARDEPAGLWGGAGEQRRRTLRRARAEGLERLEAVLAAHWRQLDGTPSIGDRDLLRAFGEGATHGRRVTHAKGCRDPHCCLATALDGLPGGQGVLAAAEARRRSAA